MKHPTFKRKDGTSMEFRKKKEKEMKKVGKNNRY